jgi:subtilisin family serine protease
VSEVRPYDLLDSVSSSFVESLETLDVAAMSGSPSLAAGAGSSSTYEAMLQPGSDVKAVETWLASIPGVHVVGKSDVAIRFSAPAKDAVLASIAALPEVAMLSPYSAPTLFCDRARGIVGVDPPPGPGVPWTGKGQVVAVFDSGIDAAHPDFGGAPGAAQSRIAAVDSFQQSPTADAVGHGTHVAGTIAGNGAASAGAIRGLAPDAKLAVVAMVDSQLKLQLPPDLADLMALGLKHKAKIFNCSWARRFGAGYDSAAFTLDRFIHQHPDVLVVVAAGNEGSINDAGEVELGSVGSPAVAKNVLTVGACGSDRNGQKFMLTWGEFDPARFPVPPTSAARLTPGHHGVAAISGRGPTDYESIKPDVLAPGTFVLAPRSSTLLGSIPWVECKDFNGKYVYMHGTSMAAPVVSGAAAVLREYLASELQCPAPSAALMRALLTSATSPFKGPAKGPRAVGYPDFDQGYGRLNLREIIPIDAVQQNNIVWVDVPSDDPGALESGAAEGAGRAPFARYAFNVAAGATRQLRITLAWTDPPGNDIQNDLQLRVQLPDGNIRLGNDELTWTRTMPRAGGAEANTDRHNTIEQVRLVPPLPGQYSVRIWARNTSFPPQGYALAVCGPVQGRLTKI